MAIYQAGTLNTTALVVPDLYVIIVPPSVLNLNGVPTNIVGMVGSATWGPVNTPTIISGYSTYLASFGPLVARKFDMGTHLSTAVLQGASNFRCVRVTDGTDVAAQATNVGGTGGLTLIGRSTGSLGNQIGYTLTAGSKANTTKLIIFPPVGVAEIFDNIVGSGTALWANLAAAVNGGAAAATSGVSGAAASVVVGHRVRRGQHVGADAQRHGCLPGRWHGRRNRCHRADTGGDRRRAAHRHVCVAVAGLFHRPTGRRRR